jgi:hypothetical protein
MAGYQPPKRGTPKAPHGLSLSDWGRTFLTTVLETRTVALKLKSSPGYKRGTACNGHYADTDFRFSRHLNRLHRASYSRRGAFRTSRTLGRDAVDAAAPARTK